MAIDPSVNIANALKAYDSANRSGSVASSLPAQEQPQSSAGTFSQMVNESLNQAVVQGKSSETAAIRGITDGIDMAELAVSVNEAELTLQTVVAVRDKVVEAYREILRMPI